MVEAVDLAAQAAVGVLLDLECGFETIVHHIFCEDCLLDVLQLLFQFCEAIL